MACYVLKRCFNMDERNTEWFREHKELVNPDEFLLREVKMAHYEVMDEGSHVWMGFYMNDSKTIGHLHIFLNNGKIQTRYEEEELEDV